MRQPVRLFIFLPEDLEFLSYNEVELWTTGFNTIDIFLETISPVNTHQTDHGQQNAHTDTRRTLHIEGIKTFDIRPGITAFNKSQGIHAG